MSNIVLAAGGDDGYQISRSVRLRSSASGYFSKTFGAAGNRKKWTYSAWIKRGALGTYGGLIASKVDGNNYSSLEFSGDELRFVQAVGGSITVNKKPAAVFRDPSAWYHIIAVMDTDNATAEDRFILYVNGARVTTWASNTPPSLGLATGYINSTTAQWIGLDANPLYFDGYIADVNFIDGLALTASSFGETDPLTGVWKPKAYGGSRGTNGFYLNFSDPFAATAAAIGKDSSGNGNNWTPNNISVTAGATYDSMIDVPTMWADGGNGRGNYCVLSPTVAPSGRTTLSDANLQTLGTSSSESGIEYGTIQVSSGKWYWEGTVIARSTTSDYPAFGAGRTLVNNSNGDAPGFESGGAAYFPGGTVYKESSLVTTVSSYTTNDVIGIALDVDALTCAFYKNGTLLTTVTGLTAGSYFATIGSFYNSNAAVNFGQRPFAYTPPTGFKALNTQNLPDATIKAGNKFMDVSLWTGNGSSQSIVNSGAMQPDLVWTKGRSGASNHSLVDSVRGIALQLSSNQTAAEVSDATEITALNSNGFSVGNSSGGGYSTNANGTTYAAWQWKKGAAQGFDIVTYTGNGSARTIAHSLGVAPKLVIVKQRSGSGGAWPVWHASFGTASNTDYVVLNGTGAKGYAGTLDMWNATIPTSSVFSVGTYANVNSNAETYVAYLFAEVAGFSKFGSYTGNGDANGPFVFCGFRPRYVLRKRTDAAWRWMINDSARSDYNVSDDCLFPNYSNAEEVSITNWGVDLLSNGFKIRSTDVESNASGGTYIYAAFAENPFKNSLAR